VIEPEVESTIKEATRFYRSLLDLDVAVDILVMAEDKARRRAKVKGTVVERALREGRDLGTRPNDQESALLLMRVWRGFLTRQIPDRWDPHAEMPKIKRRKDAGRRTRGAHSGA
jgi:hypothetical protein